jgi:hypothetical protein
MPLQIFGRHLANFAKQWKRQKRRRATLHCNCRVLYLFSEQAPAELRIQDVFLLMGRLDVSTKLPGIINHTIALFERDLHIC